MDACSVVIICILLIAIYYNYSSDIDAFINRKRICNNIDGRCYQVFMQFESTMSASEMLAYLNTFAITLMRHMRKKFLWDGAGTHADRHMVENLLANYNPDAIVENNPASDINTSYVEDKGRVFALCLREKVSGKNAIHNKNILEFVTMHEMAHMASDAIGHEDAEFWINFKKIMIAAVETNMHTPIDYSKYNINYCSLVVNYSPYYDNDLRA